MKFKDRMKEYTDFKAAGRDDYFKDVWLPAKIESLPKEYQNNPYKIDKAQKIMETVEEISVFIYGISGSGKTTTAAQLLKILWKKRIKGMFLKFPGWKDSLLNMRGSDREIELKRKLDFQGLLVLDDFLLDQPTRREVSLTYTIVDHRESNHLPMLITSNLKSDEIYDRYNPKVSGRIQKACKIYEWKSIENSVDYRVQEGKNE